LPSTGSHTHIHPHFHRKRWRSLRKSCPPLRRYAPLLARARSPWRQSSRSCGSKRRRLPGGSSRGTQSATASATFYRKPEMHWSRPALPPPQRPPRKKTPESVPAKSA
ncbi:unnamed protein product, partial [Laminaria digitata]